MRSKVFGEIDASGLRRRHPEVFRVSWRRRAAVLGVLAVVVGLLVFGIASFDVDLSRIVTGFRQLGWFLLLMIPPDAGGNLLLWLDALGETIAIAFLGTLIAAVLAFPLGILAARNVIPNAIFHFSIRRALDTVRSVETLIWALIWINVVGLGPFAGVLAIASSDLGTFGKLFSEAIETADRKAMEGVQSAGGGRVHAVRFGILPQVLPVMVSQVLYYFESNTRSATIIGIVGAGGIGLHLSEQIRTLEWQHVSFLILMVLVTVAVIDQVSTRLRMAMIGRVLAPV